MKFSFYKADVTYCDFLRKSDPCVPYTLDQKNIRQDEGESKNEKNREIK